MERKKRGERRGEREKEGGAREREARRAREVETDGGASG